MLESALETVQGLAQVPVGSVNQAHEKPEEKSQPPLYPESAPPAPPSGVRP